MDRLPSDLLRCIAQTLVDELLACALPPFGVLQTAAPEACKWLPLLALQASHALRELSCVSQAWAGVAAPLWRTLLVVNADDAPIRSSELSPAVRILVIGGREGREHRARLQRAWASCSNVRTVIASRLGVLVKLNIPPLAHCTAFSLDRATPNDLATLLAGKLPALRTVRMMAHAGPRGVIERASEPVAAVHLVELTMTFTDRPGRIMASCPSLRRLDIDGEDGAYVRDVVAKAPTSLTRLIVRSWRGTESTSHGGVRMVPADVLAVDLRGAMAAAPNVVLIDLAAHVSHVNAGSCPRCKFSQALQLLAASPVATPYALEVINHRPWADLSTRRIEAKSCDDALLQSVLDIGATYKLVSAVRPLGADPE